MVGHLCERAGENLLAPCLTERMAFWHFVTLASLCHYIHIKSFMSYFMEAPGVLLMEDMLKTERDSEVISPKS